MSKLSTTSTGILADQYAHLVAQQADLAKKVKALKQRMLETGKLEFNGTHARVTISFQTGRTGNDMAEIKKHYEAIGVDLPTKPLANSTRFNVNAVIPDTSVSA